MTVREPAFTVVIASTGRPRILHDTVAALKDQSVHPAEIVIVRPYAEDVLPETLEEGNERLSLYGWLEDLDFARSMLRRGRVVKCTGARIAHLGVSSGRQSEARYGFSQVMNPFYLWRKGQISLVELLELCARPIAMNMM